MSLRAVWGRARQVWERVSAEPPAPYVRVYTRYGTTLRGYLVGQHAQHYELAQPESLHEGMQRWVTLAGRARVRVPREAVDYYVLER